MTMRSSLSAAFLACLVPIAAAQPAKPIDQRLYQAVQKGDITKVRILLDKGANPNALAEVHNPILFMAAMLWTPNFPQVAKLLLDHGADARSWPFRERRWGWFRSQPTPI